MKVAARKIRCSTDLTNDESCSEKRRGEPFYPPSPPTPTPKNKPHPV